MPFSAIDYSILNSHGFFGLYSGYRDRLIAHARSLYQDEKSISGITPSLVDLELLFEVELTKSGLFNDIVVHMAAAIPFPQPSDPYWELFVAGPIARYVIEKEWVDIAI